MEMLISAEKNLVPQQLLGNKHLEIYIECVLCIKQLYFLFFFFCLSPWGTLVLATYYPCFAEEETEAQKFAWGHDREEFV